MADFTNIVTGLKITSQIPLDVKKYSQNEATLAYLGVDNNLAYTYHDQIEILCLEEKSIYKWREVQVGEENTGLIPLDFTYPALTPSTFGVDYANKTFNFFQVYYIYAEDIKNITSVDESVTINETLNTIDLSVSTPSLDGSETIVNSGTNTTVTGSGTLADPYIISSSYINTTYTAGEGLTLDGTTFNALNNLQKIITDSYVITDSDNNYTIIINNNITPINITIPTGLIENIFIGFIQKGTADVTFVSSGTTIHNPIGLKSKGQYYNTSIEQEGSTNVFYLLGNTKV